MLTRRRIITGVAATIAVAATSGWTNRKELRMSQPVSTDPAVIDLQGRVGVLETSVAALNGGSTPPVVGLQPPSAFVAVVNANRSVTCNWTPATDAVSAEVHEFDTDPLNTLKGTYPTGTNTRTSGVLTGGHTYTYAARSVDSTGGLSGFSPRITLYVPTATETVTPVVPAGGGVTGAVYPSDVFDLTRWTVMLPTGAQGSPDNDFMINRAVPDVFFLRNGAIVCKVRADGVHSPNSNYPRTELRQQINPLAFDPKAAWSSSGTHSLEMDLALDTRGLTKRRRLVGMQIHDSASDVCEVMLDQTLGLGLGLSYNDGNSWASIDSGYVDGTKCTIKLAAISNRIQVTYNGVKKVDIPVSGSGWYFKTGCYLQTSVAKWSEPAANTGEVTLWKMTLVGGGV